jgi:16S rRNA processing protein RimM
VSERVVVGVVRRTRGVHGELVIEPKTDLPDRFKKLGNVYLVTPEVTRTVTITSAREPKAGEVWITLEEVTDREEARRLSGATLEIDLERRPKLPKGIYYYDELEGLEVVDTAGHRIGRLRHVVPRGGQDVYIVDTESGEAYVPAVPEIIKSVDLKTKTMTIDPPAGLIETDED